MVADGASASASAAALALATDTAGDRSQLDVTANHSIKPRQCGIVVRHDDRRLDLRGIVLSQCSLSASRHYQARYTCNLFC